MLPSTSSALCVSSTVEKDAEKSLPVFYSDIIRRSIFRYFTLRQAVCARAVCRLWKRWLEDDGLIPRFLRASSCDVDHPNEYEVQVHSEYWVIGTVLPDDLDDYGDDEDGHYNIDFLCFNGENRKLYRADRSSWYGQEIGVPPMGDILHRFSRSTVISYSPVGPLLLDLRTGKLLGKFILEKDGLRVSLKTLRTVSICELISNRTIELDFSTTGMILNSHIYRNRVAVLLDSTDAYVCRVYETDFNRSTASLLTEMRSANRSITMEYDTPYIVCPSKEDAWVYSMASNVQRVFPDCVCGIAIGNDFAFLLPSNHELHIYDLLSGRLARSFTLYPSKHEWPPNALQFNGRALVVWRHLQRREYIWIIRFRA